MLAQMISGFFQYEPCELEVREGTLQVTFSSPPRCIQITAVTEAILSHARDGASRLGLTTEEGRYEFLLIDPQAPERAAKMLYELTKDSPRLELRTS